MNRFVVLIAATALLLMACAPSPAEVSDGGEGSSAAPQGDGLVAIEQVPASPRESVPSGLDDPFTSEVPPPLIDPADLRAGGPPPDGIPAIDEPVFERAGKVDWLSDSEPVLVLQMQGLTRAYPVQIMIWHEIVNDSYDDVPVAVTYCPLCNSAIAFDRRVAGRVLTFGTSGMLLNSDLVMYDRQTESLWPQLQMGAVVGELTGTELEPFVLATVPWAQFRDGNPDALVLSRETGYERDYGRNPYIGYDEEGTEPFLFDGDADPRLPAKTSVVGLFPEEQPTAVLVAALVEGGPVNLQGPQGPVVAWVGESVASALDEAEIAAGRSVPTVAVFAADVEGQSLSFVTRGGGIVDEQTGSQWDDAGLATGGPLQGTQLDPLPSVTTFWFAWAAFQPETDVIG